jgi:hypothetical protein
VSCGVFAWRSKITVTFLYILIPEYLLKPVFIYKKFWVLTSGFDCIWLFLPRNCFCTSFLECKKIVAFLVFPAEFLKWTNRLIWAHCNSQWLARRCCWKTRAESSWIMLESSSVLALSHSSDEVYRDEGSILDISHSPNLTQNISKKCSSKWGSFKMTSWTTSNLIIKLRR